jgi:DNA polymerase III delta subunit
MKANLESILADIRKGRGPSFLLVHGDDFQVRAAAEALVDAVVPAENRAFNLERFDGRSAPWDQIEASLMTAPFFPGIKLVWVEDAPYFTSAENKAEMAEKILRLWSEGKKDEAGRLLFDLLHIEEWTQERWERLDARSSAAEVAALLGEGGKEVESLVAHCRAQNLQLRAGGGEAERLAQFLDRGLPPWGLLLLAASHVDRRTRLYKNFGEKNAVLDLALVRGKGGQIDKAALGQFLDRRLSEAGKRIEPRAREMILARAGTELWSVHQEIEKLLLYVGDAPAIRARDVEEVVLDQGEGWVFDLTDALIARNPLSALAQVARLMAQGNHPLALLAPIANSFRRLLIARACMDAEMRGSGKSRMTVDELIKSAQGKPDFPFSANPRAAYMNFKNAGNFTAGELARDLELLYQTDIRLKSSGHSPRIVMERLIFELCQR